MEPADRYLRALLIVAIHEVMDSLHDFSMRPKAITALDIVRSKNAKSVGFPITLIDEILLDMELLHFEVVTTPYARPRYASSEQLQNSASIDEMIAEIAEKNDCESILRNTARLGDDWLFECVKNVLQEAANAEHEPNVEISVSEKWEPIPLEYEDQAAKDAIEKLEAAANAIQNDNGYATAHPEERDNIVSLLRTSVADLKIRSLYTRYYFEYSIIRPLQKASARLGRSATGEVVRGALSAIRHWVKDRILDILP